MKANDVVDAKRRILLGVGVASVLVVTACGGGGGAAPDVPVVGDPVIPPADPPLDPPVVDLRLWQPAEELDQGVTEGIEVSEPRIALDGNRGGMAVWVRTEAGRSHLWASRYAPGGPWQPAEQIDAVIGGQASKPGLVMDSSGNALVVWEQTLIGRINVASIRFDGTAREWEEAFVLHRNAQTNGTDPRIAMDGAGNAVAVWSQAAGVGDRVRVMSSVYLVDSGWGNQDLSVDDPQGVDPSGNPQVVMDTQGNAVAVWQQVKPDQSGNRLFSSRLRAGEVVWGAVMSLPPQLGAGSDEMPHLAIAPDGMAMVVWQLLKPNGDAGILARRLPVSAGAWEDTTVVVAVGGLSPVNPQVVVDGSGNALAVWDQAASLEGARDVMASRFTPASESVAASWSVAENLERVRGGLSERPQIALDADGNALVVWDHFDGNRSNVLSARYLAGGSQWSLTGVRLEVEGAQGSASAPRIAMRPDGTAIGIWGQMTRVAPVVGSVWTAEFK